MKIIFFGTPDFVIPVLAALHKKYNSGQTRNLIAVVTQPGKEFGREKFIKRSPVDNWAYKHKIEVITDFADIPDADLGIVAAFGSIIPKEVINKFSHGILNIHPSLLPAFRGASPTQAAIVAGNELTGITIIKMDELMDHGPVVAQLKSEIFEDDTNEKLRARLFEESVPLLMELISPYISGKIKPKEQDHTKATFTRTINRNDGFIPGKYFEAATYGKIIKDKWEIKFIKDFSLKPSAKVIDSLARALYPWPGIWTYVNIGNKKRRLIIKKSYVEGNNLVVEFVQLEGKNEVSWKQFNEGYKNAEF